MTRRKSYQRGNLTPTTRKRDRKQGWRLKWRDAQGEQQSVTVYEKTKKEARALLDDNIRQAWGRPAEATEMSFKQFVDDVWWPHLQRRDVKRRTLKGYECNLRNHIVPFFGEMRLADIGPIHVEKWLQGRTALSAKSEINIVGLLDNIFRFAVDNDLISANPVRKRHKPKRRRTQKPAWTPEQVRQIVDAAPADYRHLFVCVALAVLRLSELLALRWMDVDFLNSVIHVRHSLWMGELESPKTEASATTVPMRAVLKSALTELRQRSQFKQPESFVFCNDEGQPLNPDVLRKDVLYRILDKLGIERTSRASGFHAFRHAAATAVQGATKNMVAAQKLLRHANYNTTADIYCHGGEEAQNEAAEALEAAIFPDLFQNVPKFGTGTEPKQ